MREIKKKIILRDKKRALKHPSLLRVCKRCGKKKVVTPIDIGRYYCLECGEEYNAVMNIGYVNLHKNGKIDGCMFGMTFGKKR